MLAVRRLPLCNRSVLVRRNHRPDAAQDRQNFRRGRLRGLEAYQSGFLISGEGHILTAWSYVLDSDVVTVYLTTAAS